MPLWEQQVAGADGAAGEFLLRLPVCGLGGQSLSAERGESGLNISASAEGQSGGQTMWQA